MSSKHILFLLLFSVLFSRTPVFAQQDGSLADSVRQAVVSHDRRLLLDRFWAGRLDSVTLLLDSLDCRREMPLLWPAERLLLYYWIERYGAIDSLARNFETVCREAPVGYPSDRAIWNALVYHSSENIDTLVAWIDQTGCGDEVFDFRVRLLETMTGEDEDDQASVNRKIIALTGRHVLPEKEPAPAIKDAAPATVVTDRTEERTDSGPDEDPWKLGLGIGLGTASVTGNIADYLSARACLAFNIDAGYRRWLFSMFGQAVLAKLKRDIPAGDGGDVWEAGKAAGIGNFGLALGYSAIDCKYLRTTPFIGLAVSECTPGEQQVKDNEALKDAGIYWGFTSPYGLDTEIKLYNMIKRLKENEFLVSLNVRFNYVPAMFNHVKARYSGDMLFVTFGVYLGLSGL